MSRCHQERLRTDGRGAAGSDAHPLPQPVAGVLGRLVQADVTAGEHCASGSLLAALSRIQLSPHSLRASCSCEPRVQLITTWQPTRRCCSSRFRCFAGRLVVVVGRCCAAAVTRVKDAACSRQERRSALSHMCVIDVSMHTRRRIQRSSKLRERFHIIAAGAWGVASSASLNKRLRFRSPVPSVSSFHWLDSASPTSVAARPLAGEMNG